jgi:hypothetical protein
MTRGHPPVAPHEKRAILTIRTSGASAFLQKTPYAAVQYLHPRAAFDKGAVK